MKPFAIVAPRAQLTDKPAWVGLFDREPRLVTPVEDALQFARERDAETYILECLDPSFQWTATSDFENPPLPAPSSLREARERATEAAAA